MLPPSLTLFAVRVLSKTPHACFAAVPNVPAATAGCQAGGSCVADRSKRPLRVGLTRSTHGRRTAGFVKGYQTPARHLAVRRAGAMGICERRAIGCEVGVVTARWGRLPDEAVAGPGEATNELRSPSPQL